MSLAILRKFYDGIERDWDLDLNEIKNLIAEGKLTPYHINSLFEYSASFGRLELLKSLLEKGLYPTAENHSPKSTPIECAARDGHLKVVEFLLADKRMSLHHNCCPYSSWFIQAILGALKEAAAHGYFEIVKLFMADEKMADYHLSDALTVAAESGHAKIVELLLADKRVDPTYENNKALIYAIANGHFNSYGHFEIVKLLLKDGIVNPAADNNRAFTMASSQGHFEIVMLLLADKRVDPTSDENSDAIKRASSDYYSHTVNLLLATAIERNLDVNAMLKVVQNKQEIFGTEDDAEIIKNIIAEKDAILRDAQRRVDNYAQIQEAKKKHYPLKDILVDRVVANNLLAGLQVADTIGGPTLLADTPNGRLALPKELVVRISQEVVPEVKITPEAVNILSDKKQLVLLAETNSPTKVVIRAEERKKLFEKIISTKEVSSPLSWGGIIGKPPAADKKYTNKVVEQAIEDRVNRELRK
jgi:ankyrin repeat protein